MIFGGAEATAATADDSEDGVSEVTATMAETAAVAVTIL
jgi:hypothetical protein